MSAKKRLGEMLLEAGVIDETQLHAALGHQRKWGGRLGQALIDLKLATEPQIVAALSRKFGYGTLDLAALPRTPQLEAALKLVPRETAMRQTLLPLACDSSSITVAMADPSNIAVVDELSFRTGRRIKIVLAGDREIAFAVRRFYYADEEPPLVAAIPLEEISTESPFETTSDPFAAVPGFYRERAPEDGRGAPAPAEQRAERRAEPGPTVASPPPLPPAGARAPARTNPYGPSTPALPRGADTAPTAAAARNPAAAPPGAQQRGGPAMVPPASTLAPLTTSASDLLGEPILATELAPPEDASDGPVERQLTPRQSAMLDALERAARGEESGLVRPGQLAAVLVRLLVKRGIVSERELLEELLRK
jgi:hypothetical protein